MQLPKENTHPSGIQALVFDFDGLIVDTEFPAFRSWQEIYEEFGCQLPFSKWATLIGTSVRPFEPFDYLQEQCSHTLDRESIEEKRQRRRIELIEAEPILPGIEACLVDARRMGIKLGVASSSSRDWVDGHLKRLGLYEHFDCTKCREDVTNTKPYPDLYQTVLENLAVSPNRAIAFEDSPNGILSAKRAGMFCVAIPCSLTSRLPIEGADLILSSLADMSLESLLKLASSTR